MRMIVRALALVAMTGTLAVTGLVSSADARDGCGGSGQCNERQREVYRHRNSGCGGSGQCNEQRRRYERYRPPVYGCGGSGQCRDRSYDRRRYDRYDYEDPAYRYDYGYEYN